MANGIKIGNLAIDSFKVGSGDCTIYLGDTLLYSGGTQPTPPTPTGDTWVVYHNGDTIPTGVTFGGVRISSATTIDNGSITFYFDTTYSLSNSLEIGNDIVCTESECSQYCCIDGDCMEEDEETGECIDYVCYEYSDEECCGYEECTEWADGFVMFDNDVQSMGEFSFTNGYWTFTNYDLYLDIPVQALFDIELLVRQ